VTASREISGSQAPWAAIVLIAGWGADFLHFQQFFVKRWRGVMTIEVPEGQHHIAATGKDENLWVENYDPATNTCRFSEYSKANLLQGKVRIRNLGAYPRHSSSSELGA